MESGITSKYIRSNPTASSINYSFFVVLANIPKNKILETFE